LVQIVYRKRESTFVQRVAVYHNLARLDFPCTVDWQEIGTRAAGSQFLKVAFPLNLQKSARATFEIPFGTIEREANGHEYPSQKWLDVSDKARGVSLLNDCKYGCDINRNVMRLSLLRASFDPDPIPDRGLHHFTYAISPHAQDWKNMNTLRQGLELNQPLLAIFTDRRAGSLPPAMSYLQSTPQNIIVTAFKKSHDDNSLILRFYETCGQAVDAQFNCGFPLLQVKETDLLERDLENGEALVTNNSFQVAVAPYEIRTFRLIRDNIKWQKRHPFEPI
jgi:alpha-mannosidase